MTDESKETLRKAVKAPKAKDKDEAMERGAQQAAERRAIALMKNRKDLQGLLLLFCADCGKSSQNGVVSLRPCMHGVCDHCYSAPQAGDCRACEKEAKDAPAPEEKKKEDQQLSRRYWLKDDQGWYKRVGTGHACGCKWNPLKALFVYCPVCEPDAPIHYDMSKGKALVYGEQPHMVEGEQVRAHIDIDEIPVFMGPFVKAEERGEGWWEHGECGCAFQPSSLQVDYCKDHQKDRPWLWSESSGVALRGSHVIDLVEDLVI